MIIFITNKIGKKRYLKLPELIYHNNIRYLEGNKSFSQSTFHKLLLLYVTTLEQT